MSSPKRSPNRFRSQSVDSRRRIPIPKFIPNKPKTPQEIETLINIEAQQRHNMEMQALENFHRFNERRRSIHRLNRDTLNSSNRNEMRERQLRDIEERTMNQMLLNSAIEEHVPSSSPRRVKSRHRSRSMYNAYGGGDAEEFPFLFNRSKERMRKKRMKRYTSPRPIVNSRKHYKYPKALDVLPTIPEEKTVIHGKNRRYFIS